MDPLDDPGLEAQEIDLAPALLRGRQPGVERDAARVHRRDQVQDIGTHILVEVELEGLPRHVDIDHPMAGTVFDQAGIAFGPGLAEQCALGRQVGVGVEHQDLAARLVAAQVLRHQAGTLVGTGRAAVGAGGMLIANRPPSGMACSWRRSASVCAPAFQACGTASLRAGLLHAGHFMVVEADTGRDDQAVVG